ncbi:MAG: ABC transporter permease [Chloroflexota bacterium]
MSPLRRVKPLPLRIAAAADGLPVISVGTLVIFILVGILAPYLAPYSPIDVDLLNRLRPPAWEAGGNMTNILGTDQLGRDILSRVIHGARVSLLVMIVSIPVSGAIGVSLGMEAAYRGGWTEVLVMRLVDISLSLPTIILALMFAVVWGPSFTNLLVLIVLTLWAVYARTAHAETLSLKERDYVLAARAIGASDTRIILVHVLPGLLNTIVILATLQMARVVLIEASLSFLGVGIPPPTPAWGTMISDGRELVAIAWWVSTIPGIALSLVILSANLAGDWLRDFLDPTLRNVRK